MTYFVSKNHKCHNHPSETHRGSETIGGDPARLLYPIVTNLTRSNKRAVKFYNGHGNAEQWIKEGKNAIRWTRLPCQATRRARGAHDRPKTAQT